MHWTTQKNQLKGSKEIKKPYARNPAKINKTLGITGNTIPTKATINNKMTMPQTTVSIQLSPLKA